MLGHLPVMPPAVSTRRRTLIDREGKWFLAGTLIVSLTSGRIEVTVDGRLGFVTALQPQIKLASQPRYLQCGSALSCCLLLQPALSPQKKTTQKHTSLCYLNKGFQRKQEQPMLVDKDTWRERRVGSPRRTQTAERGICLPNTLQDLFWNLEAWLFWNACWVQVTQCTKGDLPE